MADGFMPQTAVQETELSDDFMPGMTETEMEPEGNLVSEWVMPEVAAPQAEYFMPEMEVPGWDISESKVASSCQADGVELFSEDAAPTKIYEPKHHKKESGFAFPVPEQAAEPEGNDWMIYG